MAQRTDTILAGNGKDTIDAGLDGHDWIHAGPGNDSVQAGDGADTAYGSHGNDTIVGDRDRGLAGNPGN